MSDSDTLHSNIALGRRRSNMGPPPAKTSRVPSAGPVQRTKRNTKSGKTPAAPRSQDSSRERRRTSGNDSDSLAVTPNPLTDTQNTLSQGTEIIPLPAVRRTEPGRRSTFGYPALPDVTELGQPGEDTAQAEPTMVPIAADELYDVYLGSCRLQSVRDESQVHAKLSHGDSQAYLEIFDTDNKDDDKTKQYNLNLGRESITEDTRFTITSDDDLQALATDQPSLLRTLFTEIMRGLKEAAPTLYASEGAVSKEDFDKHVGAIPGLEARNRKLLVRVRYLEAETKELRTSLGAAEAQNQNLKDDIDVLRAPSSSSNNVCNDPAHVELQEDYDFEKQDAHKFHTLYVEYYKKHGAVEEQLVKEKARSKRFHEQRAEKDEDYEDVVQQNKALEQQLVLASNANTKLNESAAQQSRQYNDVLRRLQAFDPAFRPFTVQQRAPAEPERRTQRVDRRTASPNPYPSRRNTPREPEPRSSRRDTPRDRQRRSRSSPSRSRSRSRDRRPANPLNTNPHRYVAPPYDGTQTMQEVASTVGGERTTTFKLPDIEVWKGGDTSKDYSKWRRLAVQKCETLPVDRQIQYLEAKVDGDAWVYIEDSVDDFRSYMDILETLDTYFGRSTFERVQEAQTKISDGSLLMGRTEKFADWRGRLMAVHRLTKMADTVMISYCRQWLRPRLAQAASIGFDDEQENAFIKFLDSVRKADLMQRQIDQGKTSSAPATTNGKDKSRTPKARTRSPNDRNADRKNKSARGQQREATSQRTQAQKDAMTKAQVCFRCGDKGHQARDKKGCPVLDWDKIKAKISGVRLNALDAEYTVDSDDDADGDAQSDVTTDDEEELDEMGNPVSGN